MSDFEVAPVGTQAQLDEMERRVEELEAEVRRLKSTDRVEEIKAEGVREYLQDFSQKAQEILRGYL